MTTPESKMYHHLPTPEIFAKQMRHNYPWFLMNFLPSFFCLTVSLYFAVARHQFVFSMSFLAMTVMYFPLALAQYRNMKMACEKGIAAYRKSLDPEN